MFYLFGKIEGGDHFLSHDDLFCDRKQEQSLCDFEKHNIKNTYIGKLKKNTINQKHC